ncbi:MAG: DUF805 domain-containing protein [Phenylobacterium sp.]
MDDPHSHVGVAAPEGALWWVRGRAGRREYWAYVGAIVLLCFTLQWVPPVASLVGATVLALLQARRLHDFGRSGWWAVAAMAAPIPVALMTYAMASEEEAILAGTIVTFGLIVLIGAIPGDPGGNRFGPAPPFSAKRLMTGR